MLIAVIIVLNDVVTITLTTDRAWVSSAPEQWNVAEIARLGGMLAVGWLALAFAILWVAFTLWKLPVSQIQTLMFAYLMYSAQVTIYLTRTPDRFWSLPPSGYMVAATIGNVILATVLAAGGFLMAPVPVGILAGMFAVFLVIAVLLDQFKVWIFHGHGANGLSGSRV